MVDFSLTSLGLILIVAISLCVILCICIPLCFCYQQVMTIIKFVCYVCRCFAKCAQPSTQLFTLGILIPSGCDGEILSAMSMWDSVSDAIDKLDAEDANMLKLEMAAAYRSQNFADFTRMHENLVVRYFSRDANRRSRVLVSPYRSIFERVGCVKTMSIAYSLDTMMRSTYLRGKANIADGTLTEAELTAIMTQYETNWHNAQVEVIVPNFLEMRRVTTAFVMSHLPQSHGLLVPPPVVGDQAGDAEGAPHLVPVDGLTTHQ